MKAKRPKYQPGLTSADKKLELIGWGVVVVTWLYTIINYSALPDIIPIHLNNWGEIDGYGVKKTIFALPVVSTVFFIILTILSRYPHIFSYYPKTITEDNYQEEYTIATKVIRWLKLIIVLIFGAIVFTAVQKAFSV